MGASVHQGRRAFIQKSISFGVVAGVACTVLLSSCARGGDGGEKDVSPPEDLMQEHGVLNRILLIYEKCRSNLVAKSDFPIGALNTSAGIVKTFVEDYHERHEENFIFPRFEKAGKLTELTATLRQQHDKGRIITAKIRQLTNSKSLTDNDTSALVQCITQFVDMYRPHESREDTVLFPAFRKLISKNEYDALGEDFEKDEKKLFGEDGFEHTVNRIELIEKQLDIYNLAKFTPAV